MKIIDLTEEHKDLYFKCLEDWSDEMEEAGDHKACWYEQMKDKGLGVKLAVDDRGTVGGMIQYIPIEYTPAEGQDMYFIPCIWVHGYKKGAILLWKPFAEDAVPPKWIRVKKKPQKEEGKVVVTSFINGVCPAQNLVFERTKRASSEFGEKVEFREINTFDRDTFLEWGIYDGLFIDDKQIRTGPPPSYKKIKKRIARRVKNCSQPF